MHIQGKKIGILGSTVPWYEAIVLAYGGMPVTIEYNKIESQHPELRTLTVARLEGPMTARISGVGHVRVPAGQVTAMDAKISGSGGIEFGGVAQSLDAVVSGVGSVRASEVTGSVSKRVSGAGSVQVGR